LEDFSRTLLSPSFREEERICFFIDSDSFFGRPPSIYVYSPSSSKAVLFLDKSPASAITMGFSMENRSAKTAF
jgi:hypothetical protein